jgi:hypothetical protein
VQTRSRSLERKWFFVALFDLGSFVAGEGLGGELESLFGFLGGDGMLIGVFGLVVDDVCKEMIR